MRRRGRRRESTHNPGANYSPKFKPDSSLAFLASPCFSFILTLRSFAPSRWMSILPFPL